MMDFANDVRNAIQFVEQNHVFREDNIYASSGKKDFREINFDTFKPKNNEPMTRGVNTLAKDIGTKEY